MTIDEKDGARDWLEAELADTLDEDYELELSKPAQRCARACRRNRRAIARPFHFNNLRTAAKSLESRSTHSG